MVATFHLHCLGHRIKYGNPEVGNTTQQLLSTIWQCCSVEFIFILSIYSFFFFVIFYCKFFSALHVKHFEIWKHILWNWWVDCFIARSIMWCDISGCSLWIHFTFYGVYFFLKKTVFPFVSLSLAYRLETSGKPAFIFIIFWDYFMF